MPFAQNTPKTGRFISKAGKPRVAYAAQLPLKAKNHEQAVIFAFLCRFRQSFDTLSAERFANFSAIFVKCNFLEIGFEFTPGRFHGERAVISERGFLTAVSAYSHFEHILSQQNNTVFGFPPKRGILP